MHKFTMALLVSLLWAGVPVCADSPPSEVYRATLDSDGVQRIRIVGGDYYFKPNHIIVKVGVPVEFIVSRETVVVPHTLVLDAPEAGITLDQKLSTEPTAVTFTAKTVGKFPFHCRNKLLFFKSHRERGMEGVLEIIE